MRRVAPGKYDAAIDLHQQKFPSCLVLIEESEPMPGPRIELVRYRGVPPVVFGMTQAEARAAMQAWGMLRDTPDTPAGTSRLHVRDGDFTRDIYVNFEAGERVTSIEVWRPAPGAGSATITFDDIDIFGLPADDVMQMLRQRGFDVDTTDRHFPTCGDVALGFNRAGGDDPDDDGVDRYFQSALIAPPGYYD